MSKHRKSAGRRKAAATIQQVDVRDGLMDLAIGAGVRAIQETFAASVAELCGARYARREADAPRRWGRQQDELVLGGRRVHVPRPRVRQDGREVPVPADLELQREDALHERALEQTVGGSTRKDRGSLETLAGLEESGTSKSAVSRRYVAATTKRLEARLAKPLGGIK